MPPPFHALESMEAEEASAAPEGEEVKQEKRLRKRKKKLHNDIRSQMEFYFSDSNLMKDRFLGELITQNEGWVPLDVFFKFNKIRSFNCRSKDICKALKWSDILEVNSDTNCVRRSTPINMKENVDQCTIYVEHLPPEVDHNWLRKTFMPFGTIDYISLPRFKHRDIIKGFAFVEFSSPEEAAKACKHFGLLQDENKVTSEECAEPTTPKSKRKRGTSESEDSGKKRVRQSSLSETSSKETPARPITPKQEELPASEPEKPIQEDKPTTEKKKKRHKKKKQYQEVAEKPAPLIRVMPKEEWKRWKNKYLMMQKETMSQLKMSLSGVDVLMPLREIKDARQGKKNLEEEEEPPPCKKRDCSVPYTPGVIIRLKMKEPISNAAELKKQMRNLGEIAYADANAGEKVAYLRCFTSEECQRILSSSQLPGKARLLEGEDEKTYWDKLQSDRQNKFKDGGRRPKKGNKKASPQVEVNQNTHIKFET